MAQLLVIYNTKSGSSDLQAIRHALAGAEADYLALDSPGLEAKIEAAIKHRHIIVAAGGDGTINSIVQHIHNTSAVLGILPVGTLNHFAKALNIPLDLEQAAQLILTGTPQAVDVGTVNGQTFINNSSIGLYPRSLRVREMHESSIGKWPAALLGLAHSLMHPRRYTVDLLVKGQKHTFRTPFLFVSNNKYEHSGPMLGERATLTSGQLAIYALKADSPSTIMRSLLHMFVTGKHQSRSLTIYTADTCTIHTMHQRRLQVACDGEVFTLHSPLRYQSHHKALRVIVAKK